MGKGRVSQPEESPAKHHGFIKDYFIGFSRDAAFMGEFQPRELLFNMYSFLKNAQMAICLVSTVLVYTQTHIYTWSKLQTCLIA